VQRLYTVAVTALQSNAVSFHIDGYTTVVFATSRGEAIDKGLMEAWKKYPDTNGWTNRSVSVMQIPGHIIDEAFNYLHPV
jgi:hypothetical protein